MKKIVITIVANTLLVVTIAILQISFVSTWPEQMTNLNIAFATTIFTTIIINYHRGLIFALAFGIILDVYSIKPFGMLSISFVLSIIIINWLFHHFFTNRSYLTLITLGVCGSALFLLFVSLTDLIFTFFNINFSSIDLNVQFFYNSVWHISLNVIVLIAIFYVFNYVSNKAKSVFLVNE